MTLLEIIKELEKYDSPNWETYPGATEKEILMLESKLSFKLPDDFKEFLKVSNGAMIYCADLFGIKENNRAEDLFLNYVCETKEVGNPMPEYCLPIYPDGFGNHNCLDLKSLSPDGGKCNVIFWQHDFLYSDGEQPDIDAESFTGFLESMLNQLKEDINYDGTEKIK